MDIVNDTSRIAKWLIDSGVSSSLHNATKRLESFRLSISIGNNVSRSRALQSALLTVVNCGARTCKGGVTVSGTEGMKLAVPIRNCTTIAEAVNSLGGSLQHTTNHTDPLICIGNVSARTDSDFSVRTVVNGWAGGIIPNDHDFKCNTDNIDFTPAGVLSGALAVQEAFLHFLNKNVAGHRELGLSLWKPSSKWRTKEAAGLEVKYLPNKLWLIGLGNLGQAYLWTLGTLPYKTPNDVTIYLQDFDRISEANLSTSVLSKKGIKGMYKTRAMADWADNYGFNTRIVERRFSNDFIVGNNEPMLALSGLDNAESRSMLEKVGFKKVIDAGLGGYVHNIMSFTMRTYPGTSKASKDWSNIDSDNKFTNLENSRKLGLSAYKKLANDVLDECGLLTFADQSIGTSFVGVIAATVVVAEVIRITNRCHTYSYVSTNTDSLSSIEAILYDDEFNPGYTKKI